MKYLYRKRRPIHIRLNEDEVFKFELDISQWVEDNETPTTLTATVRSGNVTAGTPTISTSAPYIVTMSLSQTSEGRSRVELKMAGATYTAVQNIYVRYEDNETVYSDGYETAA